MDIMDGMSDLLSEFVDMLTERRHWEEFERCVAAHLAFKLTRLATQEQVPSMPA